MSLTNEINTMHHDRSPWGPLVGVAFAVGIVLTLIAITTLWEIAKEICRTLFRRPHGSNQR